jgi:hypothetical protein
MELLCDSRFGEQRMTQTCDSCIYQGARTTGERHRMNLRICAFVLLLGGGCVAGTTDDLPTGATVQAAGGNCDVFMCGTNSPQIAEFGFWDLNLPPALGVLGSPNNMGLQVYGFLQGGLLYQPNVYAGHLTARRGGVTLSGGALAGGALVLARGSRIFKIEVMEVGSVTSWALPVLGPPVSLESYKLNWFELVNGSWGDGRNVCKNPPTRENSDALTMMGQFAFHTLLFEGDRIAGDKKRDTGIDDTWFNLGCAGHALAKMALTGHTEAARNAGTFATSLAERTAMLKMLSADYCGDGTPFTVAGQPLNWRDDRGTMKLVALPAQLVMESRWTQDGAACLDKTRVDAHWTALGASTFGPDVYGQVEAHCPATMPPPCAPGLDTLGYHLLTATVPYQP